MANGIAMANGRRTPLKPHIATRTGGTLGLLGPKDERTIEYTKHADSNPAAHRSQKAAEGHPSAISDTSCREGNSMYDYRFVPGRARGAGRARVVSARVIYLIP